MDMKRNITLRTLLLIILFINPCFGQDSIREGETVENDTAIINRWLGLSTKLQKNDVKLSHEYAIKAMELSNKINYSKGLGYSKYNIALLFSNYDLEIATKLVIQALEHANNTHDNTLIALCYKLIGDLKIKSNAFDESIPYYNDALDLLLKAHQDSIAGSVYNGLAGAYYYLDNDSLTKANIEQSIKYNRISNNHYGLAINYINLAQIQIRDYHLDKSLILLKKSESIAENNILTPEHQSNYLLNINSAYCQYYLNNEEYNKCIIYANKALGMAKEEHRFSDQKAMLLRIKECYYQLNKPQKAAETLEMIVNVTDSIAGHHRITELKLYEMHYQYEKKRKEQELKTTLLKVEFKRKENNYLLYILIATLVIFTTLFLYIRLRNKSKQKALEKKNILLEKEKISNDLEYRNKELVSNVMYLLQKNEFISCISNKLKEADQNDARSMAAGIRGIIKDIDINIKNENWEEFEIRFQKVHSDFYKKLHELHPGLTPNELRLCAFLHLNMSTKEIANITFQSTSSLKQARYRLRKKLNLKHEENLSTYLSQL